MITLQVSRWGSGMGGNELRDAALGYAHRGWRVFPLHGIVNGGCTCGRPECSSPGKHPLVRRGVQEATTDEDVVRAWRKRWRHANVAIATGSASGIVVIDIDLPKALPSLDALVHKLPRTLVALTGGGGIHLLLRALPDRALYNHASGLPGIDRALSGIDLRAEGGYVVAPPSTHAAGSRYAWLDDSVPIAAAPDWLREPSRPQTWSAPAMPRRFSGDGSPYGLAVLRAELERLRAAEIGTRNHTLNRCAFVIAQLVAGGELVESAARSSLLREALRIGLSKHESCLTIDSAFDAGLPRPRIAPHRLRSS